VEVVDAIVLDPDEPFLDAEPNQNEMVQAYREYLVQLSKAGKIDLVAYNSLTRFLSTLQNWRSHQALISFVQSSVQDTLDQRLIWLGRNLVRFPRAVRPVKVLKLNAVHLPGIRQWSAFSDGEDDAENEALHENCNQLFPLL